MKFLNQRVIYSIMFYALIVSLLFVAKPTLMFDRAGNFKSFGIGGSKTVFSFGIFVTVTAMVSFYMFTIIDLVFGK